MKVRIPSLVNQTTGIQGGEHLHRGADGVRAKGIKGLNKIKLLFLNEFYLVPDAVKTMPFNASHFP